MASREQKDRFLKSHSFGVVGASNDRGKFGNRVLRKYLEHGLIAYPINPKEKTVEGLSTFSSVRDLPPETKSISIITPPEITEIIVEEAIEKGVENIWMQPGAESPRAVQNARNHGINLIADGSCILVELG
ncbi:MAG: CoA-binding protein [bacterium]